MLVGEGALHRQGPSGPLAIPFDPPAVEHRELKHAVHHALLARRPRSLQRPGGGVEPHIHALHHATGELHIVVLQEDDLPHELRHGRHLDDAPDKVLTRLVVGMGLAREDKLHGTLAVSYTHLIHVSARPGMAVRINPSACNPMPSTPRR